MNHIIRLVTLSVVLMFIVGCATPHVVQVRKPSDQSLSCQELRDEIDLTDNYRTLANKEKGMTGTNVGAVLFWWPGLVATYFNVQEAIEATENRKTALYRRWDDGDCASVKTVAKKILAPTEVAPIKEQPAAVAEIKPAPAPKNCKSSCMEIDASRGTYSIAVPSVGASTCSAMGAKWVSVCY